MADIGIRVALQGMEQMSAQLRGALDSFEGWSGSLLKTGAILSASITAPLTLVGKQAIQMAGQLQQSEIAFGTLLRSGGKAKVFLDELRDFAAGTPFKFTELQVTARRMIALGFEAHQVIPVLRTLGDAVGALGGTSEQLDRIIYNMGQMKMIGKVTGHEMRDLAMAGVKAWDYLAATLGTSIPEAMEMSRKGAIDAKVALVAIFEGMQRDFGGMMSAQMGTITQGYSNLQDEMEFMLGNIGRLLNETFDVSGKIGAMTGALRELRAEWDDLNPVMKTTVAYIAAIAAAIGPVLVFFGTLGKMLPWLWEGIKNIGLALAAIYPYLTKIPGPIGKIILAIGLLTAAIIAMVSYWDEVKYYAAWFKNQFALAFVITAEIALGALKELFGWIPGIGPVLANAVKSVESMRIGIEKEIVALPKKWDEEMKKMQTAKLNEELGKLTLSLQKTGIDVGAAVKQFTLMGGKIEDTAALVEFLKTSANKHMVDFAKLFDVNLGDAGKDTKELGKILKELENSLLKNKTMAELLGGSLDTTEKDLKSYQKALEDLIDAGEGNSKEAENIKKKITELNNSMKSSFIPTLKSVVSEFFSLRSVMKSGYDIDLPKLHSGVSGVQANFIDLKVKALSPAEKAFGDVGIVASMVGGKHLPELSKTSKEITKDLTKNFAEMGAKVLTTNDLIKTAGQGLADVVKSLWSDTGKSFEDVWKGALGLFVDIIIPQMVAHSQNAALAIQWSMAAATAGISLVVGLLGSFFGGKKNKIIVEPLTVRLKKVFDDFVSDFKSSIGDFKDVLFPAGKEATSLLSKIPHLINAVTKLSQVESIRKFTQFTDEGGSLISPWGKFFESISKDLKAAGIDVSGGKIFSTSWTNRIVSLMTLLSDNLNDLSGLMVSRFEKIKDIVNDIVGLYEKQQDFTKDMNSTIVEVQRALLSPTEMIAAQVGDVDVLKQAIAASTGEEQIALLDELKGAYLSVWGTAQDLFGSGTQESILAKQTEIADLQAQLVKLNSQPPSQEMQNVQSLISQNQTQLVEASKSGNDILAQGIRNEISNLQQKLGDLMNSSDQSVSDIVEQLNQKQSELNLLLGNNSELVKWQSFTVDGLEAVKEAGKTAYDQLIDINLEMLGVQRDGRDIQIQMASYLSTLNNNMVSTLQTIMSIAQLGTMTPEQLNLISSTFDQLFTIPKLAEGGVVSKATLAMIGEGGPEAVVPLGKMNSMRGTNVNVNGPLIMDDITLNKFVRKIQEGLRKENLRYA